MALIKARVGSQIYDLINTNDVYSRLAAVESRLNSLLPTAVGMWRVFYRGNNTFEAFAVFEVKVDGGTTVHEMTLSLPVAVAKIDYFEIGKMKNGWLIDGAPYINDASGTTAKMLFWPNGASAVGIATVQVHLAGIHS